MVNLGTSNLELWGKNWIFWWTSSVPERTASLSGFIQLQIFHCTYIWIYFFFCRAWSAPSEVTSNVEIEKPRDGWQSGNTPKASSRFLTKPAPKVDITSSITKRGRRPLGKQFPIKKAAIFELLVLWFLVNELHSLVQIACFHTFFCTHLCKFQSTSPVLVFLGV